MPSSTGSSRRRRFAAAMCVACLVIVPFAAAAPPPPQDRPKLALVLSGGGARGAAHIGVLKVLEERHVVPDLIVGTSMGAIVGGFYAAGYSPEEIEAILRDLDWNEIFSDRVDRDDRSFRRKQDDTPYFVPFKMRFEEGKPYLPSGLLAGQRLEFLLRQLVLRATTEDDFDELPVPFRAVAMDVATADPVVLGSGNLADAMRASMSIPVAFAPVVLDGRSLVDGGSAANLPVGIAQELGADVVIAVDISSPLDKSVRDRSLFEVLNQLTAFLTSGSVQADLRKLREEDVLIRPNLGDITFKSFDRAADAVALGEAAAREQRDRLDRFAATPERWNEFREAHVRTDATDLPVEEVRLDYDGWVDRRVVERRLDVPLGQPLDEERLVDQLTDLRGLDYFGMMRFGLDTEGESSRLRIDVEKKIYGPADVQAGASVRTDFDGDTSWALLARYQWLALNRRGAEWVNAIQIGDRSLVFSEFLQPLDWGLKWFVKPRIQTSRLNQPLWLDGTQVGEYRVDAAEASVDIGRFLGNWGSLRAGLFRGIEDGKPRIGLPTFPSFDDDTGGVRLSFDVDTRDQPLFSRRGTDLRLRVERDLTDLGATANQTWVGLRWTWFLSAGRGTFSPRIEAKSSDEGASFASTVFVGGFRRLSGLGDDELPGIDGGVAGVDYYHELFQLGGGAFSTRVYAGISLEAGNAYLEDDSITWSSLRPSAAVWVGAATMLGPAYIGWGWTDPDRDRFYLIFGDRF